MSWVAVVGWGCADLGEAPTTATEGKALDAPSVAAPAQSAAAPTPAVKPDRLAALEARMLAAEQRAAAAEQRAAAAELEAFNARRQAEAPGDAPLNAAEAAEEMRIKAAAKGVDPGDDRAAPAPAEQPYDDRLDPTKRAAFNVDPDPND